jgi:hypothetical protein
VWQGVVSQAIDVSSVLLDYDDTMGDGASWKDELAQLNKVVLLPLKKQTATATAPVAKARNMQNAKKETQTAQYQGSNNNKQ